MATVTKPIALDESLNTTELSSRNVADVLAQELQAVAGAIGGIAIPSADHVSYDNSGSGLSATDVQNALDEIVSDIPTVNNGTLTIQQNGTSKGSFTANSASNVNVNIETPTADKKTATDQFTTADGGLLSKCMIDLVPVQSGSGDPSPDNVRPISGHTEVDLLRCGKNKYDMGLYSSTVTERGITYVIDNEGIITATNGTAGTGNSYCNMNNVVLPAGNYIVTGCPANGSPTTYQMSVYNNTSSATVVSDSGSGATFTADGTSEYRLFIRIYAGYTVNNLVFKPMIRLATDTDTSFEPYLGHLYQVQIGSTVYGGYVDLVSGVMNVTHAYERLLSSWGWNYRTGADRRFDFSYGSNIPTAINKNNTYICNQLAPVVLSLNTHEFGTFYISGGWIVIHDTNSHFADLTAFKDWLSNNQIYICYEMATPLTIQLTPQQIETLSGQNNLSTPLSGQSIEPNGVEYKELFTFADVKSYVDKKIPDAPTTDGTYTLQAVVSGGVPTYSWA